MTQIQAIVNDKVQTMSRLEQQIQAEAEGMMNLRSLAAELAEAAVQFSGRGDGNCGEVISIVLQALADQGIYRDPRLKPRQLPRKKVIGQMLRTQVFERDEYRCVHCGTHLDLTVDHIHPESKGGTLDFSNLQTLCRSCNSSKGVS